MEAEKKYKTNDRRRETALAYYYKNKVEILAKAKERYEAKHQTQPRPVSILTQLNTANSDGHLPCPFS